MEEIITVHQEDDRENFLLRMSGKLKDLINRKNSEELLFKLGNYKVILKNKPDNAHLAHAIYYINDPFILLFPKDNSVHLCSDLMRYTDSFIIFSLLVKEGYFKMVKATYKTTHTVVEREIDDV